LVVLANHAQTKYVNLPCTEDEDSITSLELNIGDVTSTLLELGMYSMDEASGTAAADVPVDSAEAELIAEIDGVEELPMVSCAEIPGLLD
jgi:hypothetical protein